jgi:hypothetical protein
MHASCAGGDAFAPAWVAATIRRVQIVNAAARLIRGWVNY